MNVQTQMKLFLQITIVVISLLAVLSGCGPKQSDIVVLEVGPQQVKMAEYENFYSKNSGGWDLASKSTLDERERFLDLLTSYRLKLEDAYERGYAKDPDIVKELGEYRSSLAASFLIDREISEPGVREMYERRKEEIRAKHILLALKQSAPPADTLVAWNKAMSIIRQLNDGVSFDSLAVQFSDDATAKTNYGDVYYFTAGQLASSFETACYSLQKGEVTKFPVRSSAGYHVIKITDRKPSVYQIKVRHIMSRFTSTTVPDSADSANAMHRILGMKDSLKKGWNFADLAKKLSEDAGSAPDGGDLGWFERRRWVQPFDDTAFTLKPGQVSPITRTQFGFHLIYCDSMKPLPSFAEMKEDLKKRYQQYRFNDDYAKYIETLKKGYHYQWNQIVFDSLMSNLDSTMTTEDSAWSSTVGANIRDKVLFSFNGNQITVDTILTMFDTRMEYKGTSLNFPDFFEKINRIQEAMLIDEKSKGLEQQYPEFASLMKEYEDGIVLFKAEQEEVWNKVSVSDSALRQYYVNNKDKFKFPNRVNYAEITVDNDTLALAIYDTLTRGGDFMDFASRYNADPEVKAKKGENGLQPSDADDFTKLADTMKVGEISEPIELMEGWTIIKVLEKSPSRIKTYEEAGAELSNSYQEFESKRLADEWINRVKMKHPVIQHKEALPKAFTSPPANK